MDAERSRVRPTYKYVGTEWDGMEQGREPLCEYSMIRESTL